MTIVTIRADEETSRALEALAEDGRSRSEVVRDAVLQAYRQQQSARLRAEAEAAAADPEDLAEVRAIREELDTLGAG